MQALSCVTVHVHFPANAWRLEVGVAQCLGLTKKHFLSYISSDDKDTIYMFYFLAQISPGEMFSIC